MDDEDDEEYEEDDVGRGMSRMTRTRVRDMGHSDREGTNDI